MSRFRWVRAISIGVALFAIAIGIALLPIAWRAYHEYTENRIAPVVASSDFNNILSAVLGQVELDGIPPPPPDPGEPFRTPEQKPLVLLYQTVATCDAKRQSEVGCAHLSDSDFWPPGFNPAIPLRLRKELVAANRSSIQFACPSSNKVKCEDTQAVFAAFAHNGWWPEFYSRFPGTAGFMRVSNAVLSHDHERALVYLEFGCGGLCGSGSLVLLKRDGPGWLVERQERLWES